jgi:hypothetical protein
VLRLPSICLVGLLVLRAGPALAQGIDTGDDDDLVILDEDGSPLDEGVDGTGEARLDDGLRAIDDDDEDDLIIIDDADDTAGIDDGEDDAVIIVDDDEDTDPIVLIPGGDDEQPEPLGVSGPLSRLWESLDIGIGASLDLQAQAVGFEDGPFRTQLGGWVNTTLIPAQNLSFFANAFARLAVDAPTRLSSPADVAGAPVLDTFALLPIFDIYEAYAKINAEVGSVVVGRLVVPWGRTQLFALGDRLNPPDHRRAPLAFPDAVQLRQPQWGAQVRTSLGTIALEGVVMTVYEATEGSLAASNQGGVRAGRYQTALVQSPARVGGLFRATHDRAELLQDISIVDATTLGIRARQRVVGFDLGATVVYGVDEVPRLHLDPAASRYLAREWFIASGLAPPGAPCGAGVAEDNCLGGRVLRHGRTASVSADAAYGLLQGVFILKGEFLAHPQLGFLPGKTAHIVDERGLRSTQVSQYAGVIAVETGYSDWVTLSLELMNMVWIGVPEGTQLWGVEPWLGFDVFKAGIQTGPRWVHRPAAGAVATGSLFDQNIDWKLRGECSLNLDCLGAAEVRWRLPVLNVYLGGRGNGFLGWPGSAGWMRQDASQVSFFVGRGA